MYFLPFEAPPNGGRRRFLYVTNFKQNLMSFLSEPVVKYDVSAANNVVENLFKDGTKHGKTSHTFH
jgi:hypothetical protein